MACYFLANIRIDDPGEYEKYLTGVRGLASRFGGRYLAVDQDPVVLEGNWHYSRAVLIEFDSESAFQRSYNSREYQSIIGHRFAAGEARTACWFTGRNRTWTRGSPPAAIF